jgi:asparagine synthase (glutamine-hydrolysing)
MCGISGFISSRPSKAKIISDMTDIISHRGPDGDGFVIFEQPGEKALVLCSNLNKNNDIGFHENLRYIPSKNISDNLELQVSIAFGHRRLSIVELSSLGHQPMCSHNEDFWIVFNGEIYNHIELRIELETLGQVFNSNSDTEVILAAYKQWGHDCLNKFNGMWAIAIYDVERAELFMARDRFGVKPLYYWISPDGNFYFASEIKQFTILPGWEANLNHQMAYDFLAWGLCDHTKQTMFKDVHQLVGGTCLSLNINQFCTGNKHAFSEWKWYILKKDTFDGTFEEAQQIFKSLFDDAVKLRLRADVEIGTGLSGGLDSSSIVCTINKQLNNRQSKGLQNTFSACVADKRYDERNFMEIVEKHSSVKAHYV